MLEQCKRSLTMPMLSRSDKKSKETNKETLKKQRNNRNTKRKPEKMATKYMEKQQGLKALPDWQLDTNIQQSKPANIPGLGKGIEQKDSCKSENMATQEKLNPTQSKYKQSFQGYMHLDPSIQHHPAYPFLFEYAM